MANGEVVNTSKLIIPETYLPTIFDKVTANAVIPTLIPQRPKLYNLDEMIYVTEKPKAQYVQPVEGGAKETTSFGFDTKEMHKFKIQTTIRMTEDTVFANEDSSLELLDLVFDEMGESLGQGVDSGMIHAIDPHTGGAITGADQVALAKIGTSVTEGATLQATVDALPDKVIEAGFNVNGIALDNLFANELRKARNNDGVRLYPDIPLSLEVGNFEGMRAVTSANVSGRGLGITDTGIRAIIGDWNMAQWGVIREMTLRRFDVGDPDNRGYDLAYKNEVAYRVEMIFAFGVVYDDAFAVLKGEPYKTASLDAPTRKVTTKDE